MPTQNNAWDLSQTGPATVAEAVTMLDSSDLANPARALYMGNPGNVKVQFWGGEIVTFFGVLAGVLYPFGVTKVFSGTTTVTSMVALR